MIKRIKIIDFRNLQNINIKLGKAVTVIAGQNGTGKSTILALLGHVAEHDSATLLGKKFGTEYREIIKSSFSHDKENNHCVEFELCTPNDWVNLTEEFHYRAYWNYKEDAKKRRYRILPVRKGDKKLSSKKLDYPTYYLGLSRLYPIGESRTVKVMDLSTNMTQQDSTYIESNHISILSMSHLQSDVQGVVGLNAPSSKKRSVGLETSTYGAMANSAGQDNLSQILVILLSFEKLKDKMGVADWIGGLLLIDELDASLHPSSLNKLFDHIMERAINIGIQVVVTTHSLSLLEYISEKYTSENKESNLNDVELVYLTNATGEVQDIKNPPYAVIKNSLMMTGSLNARIRIPILCEDAEAVWLFKELVPNWASYYRFIEMTSGDAQMKKVINDKFFFNRALLLHDGDVQYNEAELRKVGINRIPPKQGDLISATAHVKENVPNVAFLPGGIRPEDVLWNCINAEFRDSHSTLWNIESNITPQWFWEDANRARPELHPGIEERVRYKAWFNYLKSCTGDFLQKVVILWVQNNQSEYKVFIDLLVKKTKILSQINGILWSRTDEDVLREYTHEEKLFS